MKKGAEQETPKFWIFSRLNYESKSERKSPGFYNFFRERGMLLWLVRAQHDHYESTCERKPCGIYLPFHYESECENNSGVSKGGFWSGGVNLNNWGCAHTGCNN